LILASFGLGSFGMSMWFAKYRWLFLVATIVLLSFAYYKAYTSKKSRSPWSMRILHGTTVLSLGTVIYTVVTM